jgi:hypothetical protein
VVSAEGAPPPENSNVLLCTPAGVPQRTLEAPMALWQRAEEMEREFREATAAMSPQERLDLALALGRRAVELYMIAYDVDYDTASRALKKFGQEGRRYSRCMDPDASPARVSSNSV